MATTAQLTVAAPPSTTDVLQQALAMMGALSGVVSDYNEGSQIRTAMESIGAVIEQQGIGAQALVVQALAISAMSLFGISPTAAVQAVGEVTFYTSNAANPSPATQAVQIPIGTLVQTPGAVQFQTTEAGTLQPGDTSIILPVEAVNGGAAGNVPTGSITQLISGLSYPLSPSNAAPTTGGANAQSASQGLSLLASKIASLLSGTPVSIPNGVIGVIASGTSETVQYATCYEPWIANNNQVAGFTVYIDNGSGAASSALIAAATAYLNGNQEANQPGNRPAGVPFSVQAVQPVYANVAISGTLIPAASTAAVSGAIDQAVLDYFTLAFGRPAEQSQISAGAANAATGQLTSLSVQLSYASAPATVVAAVTGLAYNRIVMQNLTIELTGGS